MFTNTIKGLKKDYIQFENRTLLGVQKWMISKKHRIDAADYTRTMSRIFKLYTDNIERLHNLSK